MQAYPLKGGLDLRTGKLQVNPGTLQDCLNYEVAGVDGYTRINGFERFDGRFRVAEYTSLRLHGTLAGVLHPGDAVTVGTVPAYVTQVETGAIVVLQHSRDALPTGLPIAVAGPTGTLVASTYEALPGPVGTQATVNTCRQALSNAVRPLVGIVPGNPAAPVSGVFWFKNRLYAIRDLPKLWFQSAASWPFRVGDTVTLPGGDFTVVALSYSSAAYQAGSMLLWPLDSGGAPMAWLPQTGDLVTHRIIGGVSMELGGAALGEVSLGILGAAAYGDTSAVVTATQDVAQPVTDEPILRQARTYAALWKATSSGWQAVDLKRDAQFSGGTAAFATFITNSLGLGAAAVTGPATFGGAATFNGADCTAAVGAADGTAVPLSGAAADELRVTGFDFTSIPDSATVLGVEVRITRNATAGAECRDGIVELVGLDGMSNNKARAVEWETTSTQVAYGGATDTWGNDNLTPAVLKAATFGVRLVTQAIDATPAGGIDAVTVLVTYRRRDATVYAWTGAQDIEVSLVDVQLIDGAWTDNDGSGWLVLDVPNAGYGPTLSNGVQLRSAASGGGDLLATLASGDAPIWLPGWTDLVANQSRYQFLATNFYGQDDYRAIYGVSGASPAFTYDGTRLLWIRTPLDPQQDLPRHVARHGAALVLGYYPGAYIVSSVGQPTNFRGEDGAVSFEIGERLTGILSAMGDALLVTSPSKTLVLHGLDPSTYQQDTVSGNRGALEYTAADVGRLLVTDQLGIAAADATQAFGDLTRTYVSVQVESWLKARTQGAPMVTGSHFGVLCSFPVRHKNQYRLYFQDGYVLTATANEPVEYTIQRYYLPGEPCQPFPLATIGSGIDSVGRERLFASFDADANRGYVFELDTGNTFDGEPIPAHFTLNPLAFNSTPQGALTALTLKRFDRMFLLGQAEGFASLALSRAIDYALPDGSQGRGLTFGLRSSAFGIRGARGGVDAPVEGYEITVRIDSDAAAEGPHTLQAIATTANLRGDSRGQVRG